MIVSDAADPAGEETVIRQLQQECDHWRRLACLHDLTNLPNRRAFQFEIDPYLKRAEQQDERVLFFYIDINQFKRVNDRYGHNAADEVLQELGRRLQNSMLENKRAFHFSGDEFVVICRDSGELASQARVLQAVCSEPFETRAESITIELSIGASIYPDHSTEPAELLELADRFMFSAKHSEKYSFLLCNEEYAIQ